MLLYDADRGADSDSNFVSVQYSSESVKSMLHAHGGPILLSLTPWKPGDEADACASIKFIMYLGYDVIQLFCVFNNHTLLHINEPPNAAISTANQQYGNS